MRRLALGCLLAMGMAGTAAGVARPATAGNEMLLPQMPLHDPYILAYTALESRRLFSLSVERQLILKRIGPHWHRVNPALSCFWMAILTC
jgi:hypothetical protein